MTVPLVVVLALALGDTGSKNRPSGSPSATSSVLAPITVPAPAHDAAADAPCTKVLAALPIALDTLPGRPARSTSSFVAAWGEPPVILRCGVPRPAGLVVGSAAFTTGVNGVFYWVEQRKNDTVFTVIDRAVYVEVTVPRTYAGGPLARISDAVARALPAVCVLDSTASPERQCTHRR